MANKNETTYGETYFTGSFHGAVGSFKREDLEKSINWFSGWFNFLNTIVPIKNGAGKSAFEIGCSIGGAANVMAAYGYKVTATDVSKYALKHAKKLSPHIAFSYHDIESATTQKNTYDIVYAFEVIEHLRYPEQSITYLAQVTKPGGYLICSTPFPYPFAFDEPTHISVKHPKEWQEIFQSAGLSNVHTYRATFIPVLHRYHKLFSRGFRFGIGIKWVNSTVFIIGQKKQDKTMNRQTTKTQRPNNTKKYRK